MCIISITFNQNYNDFILIHSRDENIFREYTQPIINFHKEKEYFAPIDIKGSGTWIYDSKRYIVSLLNGGFVNHEKKLNYKKSRGLIALQLLEFENSLTYFNEINFIDIEPFTLIIFEKETNNFYQIIWTGSEKQLLLLDKKSFIWMSSTLYSPEKKNILKESFNKNCLNYNKTEIFNWHLNNQLDLGNIKTVCITIIQKKENDYFFNLKRLV